MAPVAAGDVGIESAENTGNGRSCADMSITDASGGEQWGDAGSAPSISGKQGTPAMSVASSSALLEVQMVGEAGAECASLEAAAGLRLEMPRLWQKAAMEDSEGRSSPSGMDPSVRMSVRSDCS